MREWQDAHTAFDRCVSICLRSDAEVPTADSSSAGTSGGGGGGGVPRMLLRMYLPRITTDVRVGYADTARTLPWLNTPPRSSVVRSTRRNSGPLTPAMP